MCRRSRPSGGSRAGAGCSFDDTRRIGWPLQEIGGVKCPRCGWIPSGHRVQHELLLAVDVGRSSCLGVTGCHDSGDTGSLGLDMFFDPAGVCRRESTGRLVATLRIQRVAHVLVQKLVGLLEPLVDLAVLHHVKDNGHVEQ